MTGLLLHGEYAFRRHELKHTACFIPAVTVCLLFLTDCKPDDIPQTGQ